MQCVTLLFALFFSPAVALIIALVVWGYAKSNSLPKPESWVLIVLTLAFAAAGATITLLMTMAWMEWYEHTTGYGAGNAPLRWIFFYGPVGIAIGQLCALAVWWFKNRLQEA